MRTTEDAIKKYKHICWYPSAGKDFRPLLFISDWYYKKNNVPHNDDQEFPDLFILTDLCGLFDSHGNNSCLGDAYYQLKEGFCEPDARLMHVEYKNSSTEIIVKKFEKLRDLGLPFDHEYAAFDKASDYNSSLLLNVEIVSRINDVINRYETSILYAAVLNEFFADNFLLPNNIKTEYLVVVAYGAFGGGHYDSKWILQKHKEFGIKYLIGNDYGWRHMAEDYPDKPTPNFNVIYWIDGEQWSKGSPVIWYKLS